MKGGERAPIESSQRPASHRGIAPARGAPLGYHPLMKLSRLPHVNFSPVIFIREALLFEIKRRTLPQNCLTGERLWLILIVP